jgi:hypothetical protein
VVVVAWLVWLRSGAAAEARPAASWMAVSITLVAAAALYPRWYRPRLGS